MSGRTNYYSHNQLATSEPNLFKSGIHDGMDSNKTSVPKLANNVKALSVGMPLPVKIAGILNRDLEHPLFRSLHNQPIFEKTFLQWKKQGGEEFLRPRESFSVERPFTKLPPTFYIQLDNSGKDNKNWAVMAFLSELVARGVFKIVIASFLIVGHTHEDVDAFFSKINRALSGKHVSSIPQLLGEVYGAEEKRSLPRFVTEVADYKSHAQPYRQTFKGIRGPVAFKFSMLDNRPIYQYQLTYGDPWLPTFRNTIWKRKDPKSSVDFSVIPPPDREPIDVGMFERHANTEEISQYLKTYVKHIDSIQEKTDPTSDLHFMDQAIKVYWKNILKLLEEGWSSNKGSLEREADEERAERQRPFVGSTVERGLDSFTPLLDIQVGHMIIIRPADDFEPKNVMWLAKAISVVNRDSDATFHNHVKVDWYRPKHRLQTIDDLNRYRNCMRKNQEWEKDPNQFLEEESWVDANAVGGKRKFSLGSCPSSTIPVASDTETSEDVAEAKIARFASPVTEKVMPAAVHRVQDNVDEIIYFDTTVRQFGLDIFETEVDETSWHIARTSGKSLVCRAKTRGTVRNSRPQCGAYVARQPYAKFPAPTFRKPQERFRETRFASDRFWCCLIDVCAFGKLADFLEGRKPKVPSVWPVVRGTHLTQVEVDELTKFGFHLVPYIGPVHVLEPSMNDIRSMVNVETFPEDLSRLSPSTVAKTRAGKPFNRRHLVSKTKLSRIKVAQDGSIVLKARKLVHTGKNSFGALF
ncbi:hypothetical protein R1sor_005105 [Riccia sorocarpa]|uniref:DUF7869 domain-containing protein n=1 Tax=Riccia sorocarpa TaxID=122646 RepID=A0ABD3HM59_9MARC